MKLNKHQKEVLMEVQNHIHRAYSMLVTEFDINMTEKLSKQVEVDIEKVMMKTDKMMKKLLAANEAFSIQDNDKIAHFYDETKQMKIEHPLDQEYEKERLYKIS